jgi:hypothetical protein
MIDLFTNAQFAAPPPPSRLYIALNVVLPAFGKVRTDVALDRCKVPAERVTALASVAANVLAPEAANDMKQDTAPELPVMPLVTDTSTLPEAGIVSVTTGPAVVRGW